MSKRVGPFTSCTRWRTHRASSPITERTKGRRGKQMAIEISNAIHAMALVTVDDGGRPIFIGQGQVRRAPFRTRPGLSEQPGQGPYRPPMLAALSDTTPDPGFGPGGGL